MACKRSVRTMTILPVRRAAGLLSKGLGDPEVTGISMDYGSKKIPAGGPLPSEENPTERAPEHPNLSYLDLKTMVVVTRYLT